MNTIEIKETITAVQVGKMAFTAPFWAMWARVLEEKGFPVRRNRAGLIHKMSYPGLARAMEVIKTLELKTDQFKVVVNNNNRYGCNKSGQERTRERKAFLVSKTTDINNRSRYIWIEII
jgi:hypothetical protein